MAGLTFDGWIENCVLNPRSEELLAGFLYENGFDFLYNQTMPDVQAINDQLHSLSNPENIKGMVRYGINPVGTLGISICTLREIAKEIPANHELALALWDSGIHEARILGSFVDRPQYVSEEQMERWVVDFDSWDVCDQVCDLFGRSPFAYQKAFEWSARPEEFVKRAGFVLMAELAFHDKNAADLQLTEFFPVIVREAEDERNFVKKAVNWALRNLGKRSFNLNQQAIQVAAQLKQSSNKTARWIGSDALRELQLEKVQARLQKMANKIQK
jgi:3-methyladenine DNA glycosylase AlkD